MIPRHRRWRRLARIGAALLALGAAGLAAALLVAWRTALRSLAREAGEAALAGLEASVEVSRDALGTPTIAGATLIDVARAQGFVDAQERFFQMDLSRRYAAGELSELMGRASLPVDRGMARYLFRSKAEVLLPLLAPGQRAMLEAYSEGVNAGLADLRAKPPEYYALRAAPAPWSPADSVLAMYAMFRGLNFNDRAELSLAVMREALAPEVFEFLTPDHARDDAPLLVADGEGERSLGGAPIPGPEVVDVRAPAPGEGPIVGEAPAPVGSNNFAVSGAHTPDGRAILANDMHLGLGAPGTWRRVALRWGDRFAVGVSLPGVPGVVAGSNGRVAWGFTNVYGDFQDFRIIEVDPADPSRYRVAGGWDEFKDVVVEVRIKGEAPERVTYRSTIYGLVIEEDHRERPMTLDWPALDATRTNLAILDMLEADGLEDAAKVAGSWHGPAQNVLIATADGRIGWVMSGWLPNRQGYDGRTPTLAPEHGWAGALDESLRPQWLDPPSGLLFSANNRTLGLTESRRFGREWASGDRAGRIGAALRAGVADGTRIDEAALLALQLDTRVPGFDAWREMAAEAASRAPDLGDAGALLATWNGTADADQRAYRLLRAFRGEAMDLALEPLLAPCRALDPGFAYRWSLSGEPALRMLEERPAHLLDPRFASWDALLESALRRAIATLEAGDLPIDATWGEANATGIRHPLTSAVPALRPALSWLVDMPSKPQAGDVGAVRVARPSFGASQRLVVSPGHEADGVLHLPTGNSGHFLSRHYADQFDDWLAGRPTPLLPGETVSTFRLVPPG